MASTTTNLGLTKPAYSDDADISDINGNMDLIDAEAGKVRANVAANYDSSETYAVGDYCLHDGSLYKCSTAISSPEAWTAGHWTQIKITGELSTLNGKIANLLMVAQTQVTTVNGYGIVSTNGYMPIFAYFDENWHVVIDKAASSQGTYAFGFTVTSNADGSLIPNGTYTIVVVYLKATL